MRAGLHSMTTNIRNLLIASGVLFMVSASIFFVAGCGKPPDQKAYEEIVATMSMEKAKSFFDKYPQSPYRDKLADEIMNWCEQEAITAVCYKMILDTLPKGQPRYKEAAAYYEKHFGKKR
jgi:hypothetical protein